MSNFATGITTKLHRQVAGMFTGLAVGVIGVGLVVILIQTYQTAAAIRAYQTSSNSARALTLRCTTPGTDCYDRQAKAANAAGMKRAATVNAVVVASAYCANRPGTQSLHTITACVRRVMTRAGG